MVRCHSYGGDVWPSAKPSPHIPRPRSMSNKTPIVPRVGAAAALFDYLHFPSEEFATLCVLFSLRLHLGFGVRGEKGGYSCVVLGAPDPNRHASLYYNPYRCPL